MKFGEIVRVVAAGWLLVLAHPALAEWYEASSDHFVIYADDSERDIQRFAENLERYHSAMAFLTGRSLETPSPSNRVVIYAVGGANDIRKLAGGNNRRVAGFYIPRAGGSRAFVQDIRNKSGYPDFSTIVLLHEYAHHFLMSSSRFAMPRWLNEGAAEFFAAATFKDDGSLTIGRTAQHRGPELINGDPVPVRELLDPALYDQERNSPYDAFYGKSWLLYHYLTFSTERTGQLRQYQMNLVQGIEPLAAAEAAFGDLDVLERELRAYMRRRLMTFVLGPEKLTTGAISLRKLPPGEAAMMPLQIRSQRGVNSEQAAEILEDARAIAARYPDDPGVLTALAEAEYDAGNDAEAIAAADAAIARDPVRKNAYVQKGYAMFRQAREMDQQAAAYEAAMKPFEALNRLENDHPLPLLYYYRSFAERGVDPPENARAALEYASQLAPFDQDLQVNAAIMLMGEGKNAIARDFLAPLATNPHGGGFAKRAKLLMTMLAEAPDGTVIDLSNIPEPVETPDLSDATD
ncbi:tetratricopeptide (TPR) repeat protein [Porphyrobacter sp. MBR-155]|jgi:tetratricopeptide (TPR) repeat protein|uniref:tetratricopeptide repeat protein n=1 Tax=Porphyrobacter sp. MBR-155 TaxID=3156464 RepID=UPI0033976B66